MKQTVFSPMQLDAIGEVMNISLGSSATAVSNLLNKRVDITTPRVTVVPVEDFSLGELEPAIGVEIKYVSGLEGSNIMLLKRNDVKVILDILMGTETPEEEFEMNELTVSAVCEVMNQMMGAASTALSNFIGSSVNISTPQSFTLDDLDQFKHDHFSTMSSPLVVVNFTLNIDTVLRSEFINVMSVSLARELLAGFGMGLEEMAEPEEAAVQEEEKQQESSPSTPQPPVTESAPSSTGGKLSQEEIERLMSQMNGGGTAAPPEQEAVPTPQPVPAPPSEPIQQPSDSPPEERKMRMPPQVQTGEPKVIETQPVQMPFTAAERLGQEQAENLDLIMSVPLEVSVEIGRTRRKVEEILTYSKGSLVVLDKLAGDQVDLFVNGMCVARGDVVIIDDNFGIRITEILKKPDLADLATK